MKKKIPVLKKHYSQIDLLKGIAIISILLLHALPRQMLLDSYARFHIWQAMPIFMIIMGLTLGISGCSEKYVISRFKKLIVPFLILFGISYLYGAFVLQQMYIGIDNWYGVLPVSGSGNYFITMVFEFIVITPFIYLLYKTNPKLMLIIMFMINISYEYMYWHTPYQYSYYYNASIVRWFGAIAIGLYLSKEFIETSKIKITPFIMTTSLLSFGYLIYEPVDFQNVLAIGYPLLFIVLILNSSVTMKALEYLGKKSYEIFLAQIMVFR